MRTKILVPWLFLVLAAALLAAGCAQPPASSGISGAVATTSTPVSAGGVTSTLISGGASTEISTSQPVMITPQVGTAEPSLGGLGPTPTPQPIATDENGGLTVTLDNNGQTVTLKTGQRFLLKLGEGYDWQVEVADQAILSRVPNVTVIRGAQGLYEARQAGTTRLTASGDPVCRTAKPPCEMLSRMFEITIVVQ
ncbi:MAG TPA: hypothetical protein VF498_15810 [Anaerolineales bacterium]